MSDVQSLSNARQVYTMLGLGVVAVPLIGIVPASAAFFVNTISPDSPAGNPIFRIGLVAVACAIGAAVVRYAMNTNPLKITLGDEIKLDYLAKSISRPYSDVEQATLQDRNFKVGGYGTIPMTVNETVFTIGFHDGTKAKVNVVPSKELPFFEFLAERLSDRGTEA